MTLHFQQGLNALSPKHKSVIPHNDTIKKVIQIRFPVCTTGYKTLQDMNIPLPDIHTLQRKAQHVKLEPGVLERDCVLPLDEMAITPSQV